MTFRAHTLDCVAPPSISYVHAHEFLDSVNCSRRNISRSVEAPEFGSSLVWRAILLMMSPPPACIFLCLRWQRAAVICRVQLICSRCPRCEEDDPSLLQTAIKKMIIVRTLALICHFPPARPNCNCVTAARWMTQEMRTLPSNKRELRCFCTHTRTG